MCSYHVDVGFVFVFFTCRHGLKQRLKCILHFPIPVRVISFIITHLKLAVNELIYPVSIFFILSIWIIIAIYNHANLL